VKNCNTGNRTKTRAKKRAKSWWKKKRYLLCSSERKTCDLRTAHWSVGANFRVPRKKNI